MGRPPRTEEDRVLMRLIGQRLKWLREAMNASQQELADHVGVHQTMWSLYEKGKRSPDQYTMVRMAGKLKISTEYLLEGRLEGVDRDLAIRLAAAHPELVEPIGKGLRTDKDPS